VTASSSTVASLAMTFNAASSVHSGGSPPPPSWIAATAMASFRHSFALTSPDGIVEKPCLLQKQNIGLARSLQDSRTRDFVV
jgi:hypothetical protein